MNKVNLKDFKKAVSVLRSGGVVAHATDTCYGFAADVFSKKALKSLYKLKRMAVDKPVSILAADLKMASKYGFFGKNALKMAQKYWPGALTIIVKRKKSLPTFFNPGVKTVGIRVPNHKLSLALAEKLGQPITTTSANISGQLSPYSVSAMEKQFHNQKLRPDFILNSGQLKKNLPSTIIDASGKKIRIVRNGDVKI